MSAFIVELIVALLKAFLPSMMEGTKDSYAVAVPEDEGLEKRLRDRVSEYWGPTMLLVCCSLFLVGCGTRTVYVSDGTPLKIREKIMVKVWVKTKDGDTISTEIEVQEGWYVLPDKKK